MRKYKFLMLGISVIILVALVIYANPLVLAAHLAKSDHRFILAGFVTALISISLRVVKWKVLMKKVGFAELFPVQLLGLTISNFTPGKVAEPAKALILKITKDMQVSSSLTAIIWERVIDVLVLILFSVIVISSLSLSSDFFFAGAVSIAIFMTIIVACFAVLFNVRFGKKLFGFIRKFPVLRKLPQNFMELFYKVRIGKAEIFKCLFFTLVAWTIEGFTFYFALLAFGVQINPLVLAGIVALSVVIGIASSLPGGLGTTEIVMIFLLGTFGIESSVAIAGVIVFRFMTFWFGVFLGGLSFVYLSRKFDIRNVL